MEEGSESHRRHGCQVAAAGWLRRIGFTLVMAAAVVAVISLFLQMGR